jgi:hypothetical protein
MAKAALGDAVLCPACGFALGVPAGGDAAALVCPWCGTKAGAKPAKDKQAANVRSRSVEELAADLLSTPAGDDAPSAGELSPQFSVPNTESPPPRPSPLVEKGERQADTTQERTAPSIAPEEDEPHAFQDVRRRRELRERPTTAKNLPPAVDLDGDSDPYTAERDGPPTTPCPECHKPIAEGMSVCVACGFNIATGQKTERTFQPLTRQWEWGWPLHKRLTLYFALQAVNGTATLSGVLVGFPLNSMLWAAVTFAALQAFLLGTYERIGLERTRKGQVRLTCTWRYCFIERPPRRIKWSACEAIRLGRSWRPTLIDWWMGVVLLFHFVVPGIIWYWCAIRPDRTYVALLKDHGCTDETLYTGLNEAHARDMAETIHDVTGLRYEMNI